MQKERQIIKLPPDLIREKFPAERLRYPHGATIEIEKPEDPYLLCSIKIRPVKARPKK